MSQAIRLPNQHGSGLLPGGTGGCLLLGNIAGIPVLMHWSWFVVAYLALQFRGNPYQLWLWNILEYLAVFGLVFLHELGHAFACRSVNGEVDRIVLSPLGGMATLRPPPRPGPLLWSVIAGPLVNFVLVPITFGLALVAREAGWERLHPDLPYFLLVVSVVNLTLLIINLLPLYPLDGGQILHALFWFSLGRSRSLSLVSFVGLVGALTLCGLLLTFQSWWAAAFTLFLVLQAGLGLVGADVLGRPGWESLGQATAYLGLRQFDRALAASSLALEQAREDRATRAMAYHRRGIAYLALGDSHKALLDLTRGAQIAPHAIFYFALGETHLTRGEFLLAIDSFSAVLALNPGEARAYHQRGNACYQLSRREEAQLDLERALKLDPSLPDYYTADEDALGKKCRLEWTIETCDVVISPAPPRGWQPAPERLWTSRGE